MISSNLIDILKYASPVANIVLFMAVFYLISEMKKIKKHNPLSVIENRCRENGSLLGMYVTKGNVINFFEVKQAENKAICDKEDVTLQYPHNISSEKVYSLSSSGIKMILYLMPFYIPQSFQASAAITQMITKFREIAPEFNWITSDNDIIRMLFLNSKFALDDFKEIVRGYVNGSDLNIPKDFLDFEEEDLYLEGDDE